MAFTAAAPLVLFHHQIADIQLRRWNAISYEVLFQAHFRHIRSLDYVKDARRALEKSRQKHEKRQHQRLMHAIVSDDEESEPEWANEDIIRDEAALATAIDNRDAAKVAVNEVEPLHFRAKEMINLFMKQFPQYQAVILRKRKRSPTEDAGETARPAKRARGPYTLPPQFRKTNPNNLTAGQIFPSRYSTENAVQIERWRQAYTKAFADRAAMTSFPQPPVWSCTSVTCKKQYQSERVLEACDCNIRIMFQGTDAKLLMKQRHEWHPDRFEQCGRVKVEDKKLWQKMATEIFTVISEMLSEMLSNS